MTLPTAGDDWRYEQKLLLYTPDLGYVGGAHKYEAGVPWRVELFSPHGPPQQRWAPTKAAARQLIEEHRDRLRAMAEASTESG